MFKTLRDAWKITELRKKLMYTVFMLLIYRLCSAISLPVVDGKVIADAVSDVMNSTILGLYDMMSGSALSQASILALGIQPYINASIIIQLLTVAIPALERMAKEEGEEGKKKINKITRYSTVALGALLGYGYYTMLCTMPGVIPVQNFWTGLVTVMTFTAGSSFVMWMGEQITEHGIGNGISMILFANIVSGLPSIVSGLISSGWIVGVIMGVLLIALVLFIIFINDAERRIPVQYAKRVVGRKVYGGQSTNLPIKVSMSGVMPVIFAQSICSVPATICAFVGINANSGNWWYDNIFSSTSWVYLVIYGLMIFFFSWFYAQIQYDPVEISNNMKKNGGFIPGFRPGKPTSDFIKKVIGKIVIFGAVYLAVVAMLPMVAGTVTKTNLAIGGTSIIIVVGVALETVKALEAQMLMRHYKGFLD